MQGVAILRRRLAEKTRRLYGASYRPDTEITVTAGGTEALYAAITAVVCSGDEVIVIEPAFDSYIPAIMLNGGVPVPVTMTPPGYRIDWNRVEDAVSDRTRLLILNSPHNPTGSVLDETDIAALKQVVAGTRVLILSDEVYEHIVFDGRTHHSMARYPELAQRSFVVSSFGKTYHTTGWKTGYCLAPEPLTRELQRVHQYLTFAVNTPIQYAYADILEQPELYTQLGAFYQQKRDRFLELIAGSRFRGLPCQGTYFQTLDYSAISQETETEFARRMTVEHGVAAIPPSVFYHQGDDHKQLRFCFAKQDATLEQAAERLCRI
jgi:methionine aminotransferase